MSEGVVIKVGGSVLVNGSAYISVAEFIRERFISEGRAAVVVVSAMKGITDKLIEVCRGHKDALETVIKQYTEALEHIDGMRLKKRVLYELSKLNGVIAQGTAIDKAVKDYVLSFGEKLSKLLMVDALKSTGIKVIGLSAEDLIKTNNVHGYASINYHDTYKMLNQIVPNLLKEGFTCVIEGFIGSSNQGLTTTLGRGGSDYTATSVAALLNIKEIYLLTNVPGIMTADPSLVPSAKVVKNLSFNEAYEASIYGGKNLHPKTFEPLIKLGGEHVVYIGNLKCIGTAIRRRLKNKEAKELKLVAHKVRESFTFVGLIGEGVHVGRIRHEVLKRIEDAGIEYEGCYMFRKRPVVLFTLANDLSVVKKTVNTLHDLLREG